QPWALYALAFSPDSKTLASATGGWDDKLQHATGVIQLWDVATGKETAVLRGHDFMVYLVGFRPGGKTLVSGSGDGFVKQWDLATGKSTASFQVMSAKPPCPALSPDGKMLAVGGCVYNNKGLRESGEIQVWDVAAGVKTATFLGHSDCVHSLAFSPD